jgi:hypothetical protein
MAVVARESNQIARQNRFAAGRLLFSGDSGAEVVTLRVVPAVGRRSAATTRAVDVRAIAAAKPIAATIKARTTAARPVVFP